MHIIVLVRVTLSIIVSDEYQLYTKTTFTYIIVCDSVHVTLVSLFLPPPPPPPPDDAGVEWKANDSDEAQSWGWLRSCR